MTNTAYAFPHLVPHNPDFAYSATGMTQRDWFAGQALMGLLAGRQPNNAYPAEHIAEISYDMADAMLAARSKTKED